MDNPPVVSYNNPPEYRPGSFPDLITSRERGLGYCCLWWFFQRYWQTTLLSLRLGVDRTTIQKWRRRHKAGEFQCHSCEGCLKTRLSTPKQRRADR